MCVSPVQVSVNHLATVQGGELVTGYKAVQFHLHWGKDGGPGSEHTIDGEQYPMEVGAPCSLSRGPRWGSDHAGSTPHSGLGILVLSIK